MTTTIDPLRRAVQVNPEGLAVTCGEARFTYAEWWDRCRRLVSGLQAMGMQSGDRVAVIGPNSHRYLECYQAIPGAGMVLVPLNARHTKRELLYSLRDSGARLALCGIDDPGLSDAVEHVIDLGEGYERMLQSARPADFPEDLSENTLAGLFYTGGTTGASKGVMLTHRNLIANAMHFSMCWPFTPETRWLIIAPLFHAAGSIAVLSTVWNAGQQVALPTFDAGKALDLIERHGITATLAVPTMLAAMSEEQLRNPRDVTTLRHLSHGGSPVSTETLKRAHRAFPGAELLHIYGATETAPIATLLPGEERFLDTVRARSCGQPAPGVEVIIADSTGDSLPPGEVGQLAVRGANVMVGYWAKPEETAAALVDGWYRTGDLGYMDGEGYVFLVDRAKDMIVSGGENVYSTEVEEALYAHPSVLEAAVFSIPDERWGESVHAVVVPRESVDPDTLKEHCRSLIAGYKVPKTIDIRSDPLPKSAAGKVLKRQLRDEYWAGTGSLVAGA
jgi:long-chain acyl-CoA synthetase